MTTDNISIYANRTRFLPFGYDIETQLVSCIKLVHSGFAQLLKRFHGNLWIDFLYKPIPSSDTTTLPGRYLNGPRSYDEDDSLWGSRYLPVGVVPALVPTDKMATRVIGGSFDCCGVCWSTVISTKADENVAASESEMESLINGWG